MAERLVVGAAGNAQNLVSRLYSWVGELFSDYVFLVNVRAENERLKAENERLLAEALRAKTLASENQTLKAMLGLTERRKDLVLVPARMFARQVTPYFRVSRLFVESGKETEVREGTAVITHRGLVGRVVKVVGRIADVMLITDSRSRVAVEAVGKDLLGIVVGTSSPDSYRLRLQVSVNDPPLEDGTVLITSGHDQVFPRGIEVGYVVDGSSRRITGPFAEYDVAPAVNFSTVDVVMLALPGGARP